MTDLMTTAQAMPSRPATVSIQPFPAVGRPSRPEMFIPEYGRPPNRPPASQTGSDDAIAEMTRLQQESMAVNLAAQRLSTSNSNISMATNAITSGNAMNVEHVKSAGNDLRQSAKGT
jgi:hypothetical protein